jgi:short-chain fatty acids transporter
MIASLLNWGFSLIVGGLLVRALPERRELRMYYRGAAAAASKNKSKPATSTQRSQD